MEIEEIQDLIDFHKRNLKDSQKMAKSMLVGFMGEMVANQAFGTFLQLIVARECLGGVQSLATPLRYLRSTAICLVLKNSLTGGKPCLKYS